MLINWYQKCWSFDNIVCWSNDNIGCWSNETSPWKTCICIIYHVFNYFKNYAMFFIFINNLQIVARIHFHMNSEVHACSYPLSMEHKLTFITNVRFLNIFRNTRMFSLQAVGKVHIFMRIHANFNERLFVHTCICG